MITFTTPATVTCGDKTCADGERSCQFLRAVWEGRLCGLFRTRYGDERELRAPFGEARRCRQCLDAEKAAKEKPDA